MRRVKIQKEGESKEFYDKNGLFVDLQALFSLIHL